METTTLCLSCRYCTHASRSEQSAFQRYYSHCIEDCCFEKKAEPSAFVDCKAPSSAPNDATSANDSLPRLTEEGLQTPIGNGGSSKQYKWTQTLEECSVLIPISKNLRGKDLDVQLKSMTLVVRTKDRTTTFLDGNFVAKIIPDDPRGLSKTVYCK